VQKRKHKQEKSLLLNFQLKPGSKQGLNWGKSKKNMLEALVI